MKKYQIYGKDLGHGSKEVSRIRKQIEDNRCICGIKFVKCHFWRGDKFLTLSLLPTKSLTLETA